MNRIPVRPEMLRWAHDRARIEPGALAAKFPQLPAWEREEGQPTLKQLESFAKATRVPLGFLFLPEPPEERMPIPDFRTVGDAIDHPSRDLLDTIYAMQSRQAWLREERIECDAYAPLLFVNGADAKSAQMFTLAHELAHIWVGAEGEGLSGFPDLAPGGTRVESFCDEVAAEFLVPEREIRDRWHDVREPPRAFEVLARHFKVSPIVIGRRAMDLRLVERETFFRFYDEYTRREHRQKAKTSGGDFYNNQNTRVGEMFATQVIRAAVEGRMGFREAYDLTGLRGGAFQEYARRLGSTSFALTA